jgi:hypothetical protein
MKNLSGKLFETAFGSRALHFGHYFYTVRKIFLNDSYFFFFGATAPIWALAYLHESLRFTSVF